MEACFHQLSKTLMFYGRNVDISEKRSVIGYRHILVTTLELFE